MHFFIFKRDRQNDLYILLHRRYADKTGRDGDTKYAWGAAGGCSKTEIQTIPESGRHCFVLRKLSERLKIPSDMLNRIQRSEIPLNYFDNINDIYYGVFNETDVERWIPEAVYDKDIEPDSFNYEQHGLQFKKDYLWYPAYEFQLYILQNSYMKKTVGNHPVLPKTPYPVANFIPTLAGIKFGKCIQKIVADGLDSSWVDRAQTGFQYQSYEENRIRRLELWQAWTEKIMQTSAIRDDARMCAIVQSTSSMALNNKDIAPPNEYCWNLLQAIRSVNKSQIMNIMLESRSLTLEEKKYLEEKKREEQTSRARHHIRITPNNCETFGLQIVDLSLYGQQAASFTMYEERGVPKSRTIAMEWNSLDHATYIFQYNDAVDVEGSHSCREHWIQRLVYFGRLFETIPSCAMQYNLPVEKIRAAIDDEEGRNLFDTCMNAAFADDAKHGVTFDPTAPGAGIATYTGFICRVYHQDEFENFKKNVEERIGMDANALRTRFPVPVYKPMVVQRRIEWGRLVRVGGEDMAQGVLNFGLTKSVVYFGRESKIADITGQFTHKRQNSIPCAFVAPTHFSISIVQEASVAVCGSNAEYASNTTLKTQCRIRDFGGTFVNGELLGENNAMNIKNGDEISLRCQEKILHVYEFQTNVTMEVTDNIIDPRELGEEVVSTNPFTDERIDSQILKESIGIQVEPQQESEQTSTAMKNVLIESLTQQISMLKHEALVSNEQINSQTQQIIQLQNDLENAFQKAKNEKNLKELALKETHELKEQIFAMTADVDVLEERTKILQEENGKLEELVNDFKFNINQLQEEMKEKQHLAEQRIWQLEQALQQRTEEPSESPQEQVKSIESDVHPNDQNQSHLPLIDICENDNKVDYDSVHEENGVSASSINPHHGRATEDQYAADVSIEIKCKRFLENATDDLVRLVVERLAASDKTKATDNAMQIETAPSSIQKLNMRYATELMGADTTASSTVRDPANEASPRKTVIPLPFLFVIDDTKCISLCEDDGLFTQCQGSRRKENGLCKNCDEEFQSEGKLRIPITIFDRMRLPLYGWQVGSCKPKTYLGLLQELEICIDDAREYLMRYAHEFHANDTNIIGCIEKHLSYVDLEECNSNGCDEHLASRSLCREDGIKKSNLSPSAVSLRTVGFKRSHDSCGRENSNKPKDEELLNTGVREEQICNTVEKRKEQTDGQKVNSQQEVSPNQLEDIDSEDGVGLKLDLESGDVGALSDGNTIVLDHKGEDRDGSQYKIRQRCSNSASYFNLNEYETYASRTALTSSEELVGGSKRKQKLHSSFDNNSETKSKRPKTEQRLAISGQGLNHVEANIK